MKLDTVLSENDRIVGHIWSDHCVLVFDDVILSDGGVMICSKGEACGITSYEILQRLGAEA